MEIDWFGSGAVMRVVRRVAVVFVAVLLVLGGTAGLGPVAQAGSSAGPSCAGAVQQAQPAASTETPVVFVHGWTGKTSDFKQNLGPYVERTVGSSVRMYYFDYSAWSTYWPTDRHIAPCLAAFIHKITDPNKRPAVVVAHSMGGLAIRFAGSPTYAANPITKNQVAAVITLDTPALGSPWGSTLAAGGWGTFQQTQINKLREIGGLPSDVGGNASDCLAVHASMPRGCAIAPYLPPGIAITTVAGEATVKRNLFGIELYKVNTFSDGIVPTRSSRDYLKSGPPGTSPTSPGKVYSRQVSCDIGTDILRGDQALTGAVLAGLADNNALNELLEGNAITTSFPILAWVIVGGAACNHTTITKNPQAMQIVADYIKQHRTETSKEMDLPAEVIVERFIRAVLARDRETALRYGTEDAYESALLGTKYYDSTVVYYPGGPCSVGVECLDFFAPRDSKDPGMTLIWWSIVTKQPNGSLKVSSVGDHGDAG